MEYIYQHNFGVILGVLQIVIEQLQQIEPLKKWKMDLFDRNIT